MQDAKPIDVPGVGWADAFCLALEDYAFALGRAYHVLNSSRDLDEVSTEIANAKSARARLGELWRNVK